MAHAPARTPRGVEGTPSGTTRLCAECLAPVMGIQPGQLFCCSAHRKAFQQRQRIRGRQLTAFAMVDRMTRSGTAGSAEAREIGKKARAVTQRLIAAWAAEDKASGRMSMVDYLHRYTKHFDLPL